MSDPTGAVSAGARAYATALADESVLNGRPLCFDSSALIDYFARNEPVASLLEPLLVSPAVAVVVPTVGLAELVARAAATNDQGRVDAIYSALLDLPAIVVVDLDQQHALETAVVRAETGLKLPDAAIVATARLAGASAVIGNDRQWRGRPLGVPYHHVDDILALP